MSDSFLSIGDASSAEAVTAADAAAGVEITGGNGQESSPQSIAHEEAGAISAPVFDPQIPQPEAQAQAQPAAADDWESTRAEAQKQLENEYAPRWYRDTIRKYETRFGELTNRLDQLNNQPAVSEGNLKLYEAAKEFQLKFSQIPTSSEEARAFARERLAEIQAINPFVAEELEQTSFWKYAFDPQGRPNAANLQVVIDQVTGAPGRVKIDDVLNAVNQLSLGTLSPDDLDWNLSDEQRSLKQRERQLIEDSKAQQARWQTEMDRREGEVRTGATREIVSGINEQFQSGIRTHLENLRIMPGRGDTPDIQEFKRDVLESINSYVARLEAGDPDLQYIRQRIDVLSKPNRMDSARAENYIRQVAESLDFQDRITRALRNITDKTREYANRQARNYNRWLRGGEASRVADNINNARREPGGESWKIPPLHTSPGNSPKMSAVESGAMALAAARQTTNNIG